MHFWVDFHTHILDSPLLSQLAEESKKVGIHAWLVNTVDLENLAAFQARAKGISLVQLGVGWHPESVIRVQENKVDDILNKYSALVAHAPYLGETGLDFLYAKTDVQRAVQKEVFAQFIEWSVQHHKMIQVHTRHAKQEAIDLLLAGGARNVILHWFNGNASQVKTIVEQQWICTVGPTILNSPHVDKFIQAMPLELIGLETDSPIPFDGTPSSPAWIPRVAQRVAELKGVSLQEVSDAQKGIFSRFFPRMDLNAKGA